MPTVKAIKRMVQRHERVAFLSRMCVMEEIGPGTLRELYLARRAGLIVFPEAELVLVLLHVHAFASELYAFHLQAHALLQRGVAA